MIKSMTGYGRAAGKLSDLNVEVEIRSVNSRYLDLKIRQPSDFSYAEEAVRSCIKAGISRGKVDVFVKISQATDAKPQITVNKEVAKAYYEALDDLAFSLRIDEAVKLSHILKYNNVLTELSSIDVLSEDEVKASLSEIAHAAIADFNKMRLLEGENLRQAILAMCENLHVSLAHVKDLCKLQGDIYIERYKTRIEELLKGADISTIDESRILMEAAILVDKSSIEEEVVRMDSHIEQLELMLDGGGVTGKKMDFLMQEMNREVNTMGSKADDLRITELVVNMKNDVENIREQVQNIE
ncbi:MAG: YicC family protein [Clostridiales Family XIII bacterium]|jgi:uncharacterized protein (TIGR00255 family)|nr:YicC family protein [Clostridiales Family XIII bacterium]